MLKTLVKSLLVNCNSQFMEQFGTEVVQKNKWKTTPVISLICKPLSGEWGKEDKTGTGIKVLRTTNFTDIGKIDFSDVVSRCIDQKKIDAKIMKPGDILIEKSGGSDTKPVGRVVYFEGDDDEYLFNNFTSVLRVKKDINPYFLFYFLFATYWNGGTDLYENKTTGIHNLKLMDYLSETQIPVPPIEIQNEFVQFALQSDKSKFTIQIASNLNL